MYVAYYEIINSIKMLFGNVLSRQYDAFSSVLISTMTLLSYIFSFVFMQIIIGKKETNAMKNIPC